MQPCALKRSEVEQKMMDTSTPDAVGADENVASDAGTVLKMSGNEAVGFRLIADKLLAPCDIDVGHQPAPQRGTVDAQEAAGIVSTTPEDLLGVGIVECGFGCETQLGLDGGCGERRKIEGERGK